MGPVAKKGCFADGQLLKVVAYAGVKGNCLQWSVWPELRVVWTVISLPGSFTDCIYL